MKTNTKTNYASLLPIMKAVHAAEMSLMDALLALWDKQADKSKPMEFRKGFIEFAVANKYDRRWAMEIAVAAGFRARAAGGGRKSTKPAKNTAEALMAQAKALPAKELKRFMKMLAAL
jgi:hypothetical protein